LKIHGSVFVKPGQEGDYVWMLAQPEYINALFVFNDNTEQYMQYITGRGGYRNGKGNAVVRPYRGYRSAGIPTGSLRTGGFTKLGSKEKALIDGALAIIRDMLRTGVYDMVVYSDDGQGGLGTGIFRVNREVKDYIVKGLHDLV
jgi:hypothetical protein